MGKSKLTLYIFLALIAGVIVGWLAPEFAVKTKPMADIFLRMIKMIIAPLLFATLVVGIAGHGSMKSLGKIGAKTIIYFEIVTTLALFIGLAFANYFKPGAGLNIATTATSADVMSKIQASAETMAAHGHSVADTFINMVPTSIVQAMATGDILQVVFFSIFFALAICAVGEKAEPVMGFLHSLSEIMFKFTEYVMAFAPMGVFAAIATTVGQNGIGVLGVYAKLIGVLYGALALFVVTVLVVACKIVKIPFRGLVSAIKGPALLAFSTASSEAALPKAMELMEKFGVPRKIVGFVMPTGYTFNLDGSTLYLSLAALFVAQLAGIQLSLGEQLTIMLTLMLTSKGIAAVPRVALVILTGTLITHGLPVAGVAVLLGIDQLLDMGRTTVNLIGNCVATTVIARWEGEFNYDQMNEFLGRTPHKPPVKDIVSTPHSHEVEGQPSKAIS